MSDVITTNCCHIKFDIDYHLTRRHRITRTFREFTFNFDMKSDIDETINMVLRKGHITHSMTNNFFGAEANRLLDIPYKCYKSSTNVHNSTMRVLTYRNFK